MNFDESLEAVNIRLGDTNNVTFTPEEKIQAVQRAWDDSAAVTESWDTSLTYDSATSDYTLPSGTANVLSISLRPSNSTDTEPEGIDQGLWEVFDGSIRFRNNARAYIEDGSSLYLKTYRKLDYDTDTITDKKLQQYVVALGAWNTLEMLGYKKANLFLKNDTTMGELITLRRELQRDITRLRSSLPRAFVSV